MKEETKNKLIENFVQSKNFLSTMIAKKITIKAFLILAIVIIVVGLFVLPQMNKKENVQKVDVIFTLKEIVNTSEINTYETVYNGVAARLNEKDPEKVEYYVSYSSVIKAGFDFSKVNFEMSETDKIIKVLVPKITLSKPELDENFDYIFVNGNYDTTEELPIVFKICEEDITEEMEDKDTVIQLAKENAEKILQGLMKPFESDLKDYKLVYVHEGDGE